MNKLTALLKIQFVNSKVLNYVPKYSFATWKSKQQNSVVNAKKKLAFAERAKMKKMHRKLTAHPDPLIEEAYRELEQEGHKVDRKLERFEGLIELQQEELKQKDAFFKPQ